MIYVVTFHMQTGGPETAHQVARELINQGYDAAMFYLDSRRGITLHSDCDTPQIYRKYNLPVAQCIEDSEENVVLIPETAVQLTKKIAHAHVCIMWLSLGNYLKVVDQYADRNRYAERILKEHGLPKIFKPIVKLRSYRYVDGHGFGYDFEHRRNDIHTYNCEYARQYLVAHGVTNEKMVYLCGPISSSFFQSSIKKSEVERLDIVAYNPKKGADFAKKVIGAFQAAQSSAMKFVPIQDMTPNEVAALLSRAKVYMDFGDFPGPERIPREAVCMGCNIITSKLGAAGNDIDVPISDDLKFDTTGDCIPAIVDTIERMLKDYSGFYPCFDEYRGKVRRQLDDFAANVGRLARLILCEGNRD